MRVGLRYPLQSHPFLYESKQVSPKVSRVLGPDICVFRPATGVSAWRRATESPGVVRAGKGEETVDLPCLVDCARSPRLRRSKTLHSRNVQRPRKEGVPVRRTREDPHVHADP